MLALYYQQLQWGNCTLIQSAVYWRYISIRLRCAGAHCVHSRWPWLHLSGHRVSTMQGTESKHALTPITALAVSRGHQRTKQESDLLHKWSMTRGGENVQPASQGRPSASQRTLICLTEMLWQHLANSFICCVPSIKCLPNRRPLTAPNSERGTKCSRCAIQHDIE